MPLHSFSRIKPGCRVVQALFVLGGLVIAGSAGAATCRVTLTGAGSNNGISWDHAMTLQVALTTSTCDEVWVKAGTYTPTSGSDRTISFSVLPGVKVYGGFADTETQRSERDPVVNLTTLSGDIGGMAGNSDNSYHVVFMDGTTGAGSISASTVLDGFTISGGNADSSTTYPEYVGGGLYCNGSGSGHACSPTVSNLIFSGNSANTGGAMYNDGKSSGISSPSLSNVIFSGNSSGLDGGAMYNDGVIGGTSSPSLSNVTFSGNRALFGNGGAMFNNGDDGGTSSPSLSNVTFSDNSAPFMAGGAMFNQGSNSGASSPALSNVTFSGNSAPQGWGGAMYNDAESGGTSSPTLSNVTFSGNNADFGGAMYNFVWSSADTSKPILSNVIAWGDGATSSGPEIYNRSTATPTIDHSVIQGSGGSSGWDTALGSDGGGNLDANPLLGALANNGGPTQTLLPGAGSSAIDTGNDSTCTSPPVNRRDQRGVSRPQGPHCDIGAVEVTIDRIFADNFDGTPMP